MKRLILILACIFAMPAAAHAGCLANAGSIARINSSMVGSGRIACTTSNGHRYQLRIYIQSNAGGTFHIMTAGPLAVVDYTGPAPVGPLPNNFTGDWTNVAIPCGAYTGATQTRIKAVVENVISGSVDPDYGPITNLGTCHS